MPVFRVSGSDARGVRYERRRFEAADEAGLRALLAEHGVVVDEVRPVALSRWPFARHSWPVLLWPLGAFLVLGAAGRLVVTGAVLRAVHSERPLVVELARGGQPAEAVVVSVRAERRDEPSEWAYEFEATGGTVVSGVLQRGFGSIRERRYDVTLVGTEPATGQRFPVTYLAAEPAVHVPGRVDADAVAKLDEAVRTVQWQGLGALIVGLASLWMVRNTLLRLGTHYWLDDTGTVIEYARREPVTLRIDLPATRPEPGDGG
ncbi:MAG: hypothetical protein KA072_00260 [Thermoanaerobaculaceae bacterium]|nr:hypothetical protein [Thermoanaerobaculaceae bacterium]MDI9621316.1 hypothetical protein [Acidobacteriota bacterium]HPW54152.1 hypothetical protein [Thermoanaerobaculaceae bacterium]